MQGIGFNFKSFDAVLRFFTVQVNRRNYFFRIKFFNQ